MCSPLSEKRHSVPLDNSTGYCILSTENINSNVVITFTPELQLIGELVQKLAGDKRDHTQTAQRSYRHTFIDNKRRKAGNRATGNAKHGAPCGLT